MRAGLILMMDRTFDARQNEIIVDKALRWARGGGVGVDIAGPRPGGLRYDYTQVAPMVETARAAGLGVTIHVGEEGATGAEEIGGRRVTPARPDRARDPRSQGSGPDDAHPPGGRDARDLPDVEPPHQGPGGRGRRTRDVPPVRRARHEQYVV